MTLAAEPKRVGPFEELPPHMQRPGELLTKVWKAPYTNGVPRSWRERCDGYWRRIEERYGVIVGDHKEAWAMHETQGPVIATYAPLMAILQGVERYPSRPESETVQ